MALEEQHVAFLETVPFKVIAAFTALQTVIVLGIYGITWAGVAGVLFPIPIMLLVPFRQYIMPKMFNAVYLEELDKLTEEEAGPLPHEEAIREAQEQGLGIEDGQEEEDIESEMALSGWSITRLTEKSRPGDLQYATGTQGMTIPVIIRIIMTIMTRETACNGFL
eukprot:jgi/Picre1/35154/NNA_002616.t1